MSQPEVAPYGSWKSPLTSDLIVTATVGLGQIALDGEDVYWVELRPYEGGRNCIVRRASDGTVSDVTPPDFNARTRVHEYGGGDFAVRDGVIYFTNFTDQRTYRQSGVESPPEPVTPGNGYRYSDFHLDPPRGLLFAVREDHTVEGREAVNTLVSLRADGANEDGGRVLVSGNDFYSSPRLSPDGSRLAWLTWNHPNMPWDGCELWVGELDAGGALVGEVREVDHAFADGEVAAAVLVDSRARVEALRRHVGDRAVRGAAHDAVAPALGRAQLDPVDVLSVERYLAEAHRGRDDEVGRDGRLPGAVRCCLGLSHSGILQSDA